MSHNIRITPIAGGKSDISGSCTLLEIGQFTLLLDCGCTSTNAKNLLNKLKLKLTQINKEIDAVVLSHADLSHLGALPVLFGRNGLMNTTVVCTLPVHKFGQLVLYDYCSNQEMEGVIDHMNNSGSSKISTFDYDDIDNSFFNPTVVKFSQTIHLSSKRTPLTSSSSIQTISLCAYPCGRTIGGSIWRINYGSTEIIYAMDMNMKNDIVLNGANLEYLPSVPSLLLLDAGSLSQVVSLKSSTATTSGSGSSGSSTKKKKDKEDATILINAIMETVRNDGNVMLPCETAGRTLELLQILSTYWSTNKIGLYHLIFLSPMAYNILEFARSQLEWMSDTLSKKFYNGGSNPFELSAVKIFTSIRDMERTCQGPKVVLCTDASLTCGLSKELLLRWGGDPRCRIIFTDISEPGSLAYDIRCQEPPIVCSITRPVRVELQGEELRQYRVAEEKKKKEEEELMYRKKRENELEFLAQAGRVEAAENPSDSENEGEDGDYTDEDSITHNSHSDNLPHNTEPDSSNMMMTSGRLDLSMDSNTNNNASLSLQIPNVSTTTRGMTLTSPTMKSPTAHTPLHPNKRRKLQTTSLIAQFINPSFQMFESKQKIWFVDEYGADNDDLLIVQQSKRDNEEKESAAVAVAAATTKEGFEKDKGKSLMSTRQQQSQTPRTIEKNKDITNNATLISTADIIPTKIISTVMRVQITCSVLEIPLSGRSDFKVSKFIVSKISPSRLVLLKSSIHDSDALAYYARSIAVSAYAPVNGDTLSFDIPINRIKLQIPMTLMPKNMYMVTGQTSSMKMTQCALTSLKGDIVEVVSRDIHNLRTVRLQPATTRPIISPKLKTRKITQLTMSTSSEVKVPSPDLSTSSTDNMLMNIKIEADKNTVIDTTFPTATTTTTRTIAANVSVPTPITTATTGVTESNSTTTAALDEIPMTTVSASAVDDFFSSMFGDVTTTSNSSNMFPESIIDMSVTTPPVTGSTVTPSVVVVEEEEEVLEDYEYEDSSDEENYTTTTDGTTSTESNILTKWRQSDDTTGAVVVVEEIPFNEHIYSAVSVGDVTLNQLKNQLEQLGMPVEFKLSTYGATLICNQQIMIRKNETKSNDFIVVGPPIKAYWDVKKVLQEKFAFVSSI